jgi:hypothetical protein
MKFTWDEHKSKLNIRKHGIDFHDAAYFFSDPFALSIPDDEHSETEACWLLLGKSLNELMLLVVHTFRYDDVIRIISARKATVTETATYYEEADKMKEEYDFSNAEQVKFYVPVEDIQLPIYLDKDIIQYLNEKCLTK